MKPFQQHSHTKLDFANITETLSFYGHFHFQEEKILHHVAI